MDWSSMPACWCACMRSGLCCGLAAMYSVVAILTRYAAREYGLLSLSLSCLVGCLRGRWSCILFPGHLGLYCGDLVTASIQGVRCSRCACSLTFYIMSVRLTHIYITSARLTHNCAHYMLTGSLILELSPWGSLAFTYLHIMSVRLTHTWVSHHLEAHSHLHTYYECEAHSHLRYHLEAQWSSLHHVCQVLWWEISAGYGRIHNGNTRCNKHVYLRAVATRPVSPVSNYSLTHSQWRSQAGAHWGTCPSNWRLCPTSAGTPENYRCRM